MNLQRKFLGENEVDETKIRLSNAGFLRARNASNSADLNLIRVNSSDKIEVGDLAVRGWIKRTLTFADFSDPSTVKTLALDALNAGYVLEGYAYNVTTPFTGGAVSAATLSFGRGTSISELTTFDVFTAPVEQPPTLAALLTTSFSASDDTVALTLTTTDDNIDQLTAGSVDFYYLVKNLNADVAGGLAPGGSGAKVNAPDLTMSGQTQVLFTISDAAHNVGGNYLTTANEMIVPEDGLYLINLKGGLASASTSDLQIGYSINGGAVVRLSDTETTNLGAGNPYLNGMDVVLLVAGDVVRFFAQSSIDDSPMTEISAGVTLVVAQGGSASAGAMTDLSNLITTSINQSLLPNGNGTLDLGGNGLEWGNAWITNMRTANQMTIESTGGLVRLTAGGQNIDWNGSLFSVPTPLSASQLQSTSVHGSTMEITSDSGGYVRMAVNGGGTFLQWDGSILKPLSGAFNMEGSAFALTAGGSQTWNLDSGGGFSNSSGGMTVSAVGNLTLNANGGSQSMVWSSAGLVPTVDGSLNLGDATHRWSNLYANQVNGGGSTLAISTNSVQFVFDGSNNLFRGQSNNAQDLGSSTVKWRNMYLGSWITPASSAASDAVSITTGTAASGGSGSSGAVNITTGNVVPFQGDSGAINLTTGNVGTAYSGTSGAINLTTGNGTAGSNSRDSGNINLTVGTPSIGGTRGHITLSALYMTLPTGTSDPTAAEGSVYYNTSTHKMRLYDGTSWVSLN